jgi:hypothetical protein
MKAVEPLEKVGNPLANLEERRSADFLEDLSSRKFVPSITRYDDSLDLFISYKFRVEVTNKEPMLDSFAKDLILDSIAKDRMLDWAANQDEKLDTCQSLLGVGICSNQQGILPALGFSSPTTSSRHPC